MESEARNYEFFFMLCIEINQLLLCHYSVFLSDVCIQACIFDYHKNYWTIPNTSFLLFCTDNSICYMFYISIENKRSNIDRFITVHPRKKIFSLYFTNWYCRTREYSGTYLYICIFIRVFQCTFSLLMS